MSVRDCKGRGSTSKDCRTALSGRSPARSLLHRVEDLAERALQVSTRGRANPRAPSCSVHSPLARRIVASLGRWPIQEGVRRVARRIGQTVVIRGGRRAVITNGRGRERETETEEAAGETRRETDEEVMAGEDALPSSCRNKDTKARQHRTNEAGKWKQRAEYYTAHTHTTHARKYRLANQARQAGRPHIPSRPHRHRPSTGLLIASNLSFPFHLSRPY